MFTLATPNRRIAQPALSHAQRWLIALCVCLVGCTPNANDHLDDYAQRISRVLDEPLPTTPQPNYPTLSVQKNKYVIASHHIGLLDFLRLSHCKIGVTLAKKNGTLNKLAQPSQHMHLDKQLLQHGSACIKHIQAEQPELAQTLTLALQEKRQQRMAIWWNAWFSSNEWQAFTSPSSRPLDEQIDHISLSLKALRYAQQQGQRWLQHQYEYNPTDMEHHLQQLQLGETLGRWLHAQVRIIKTQTHVAHMLNSRFKRKPLCAFNNKDKHADRLENVFMKYYVGKVQPYLSQVSKTGANLIAAIEKLTQLNTPPPEFERWFRQIKQLNATSKHINRKHIHAWQTTLRACGRMPH